jgi:catechol 2,3-dioxygenase-like lactoylglutathione lyase family enzyme
MLGLPPARPVSHFLAVELDNGVTLDFDDAASVVPQHYAFLVSDAEFDATLARVRAENVTYFADPNHRQEGAINHRAGGRGFYFSDPDGHNLEVFTRPPL